MTTKTLVLDSGYQPHRIVSWQRAAQLLHDGRAEVVELYEETMRVISREASRALKLSREMRTWFELGVDSSDPDMIVVKMPAVIRLVHTLGRKKGVKFSRLNVLTRDNSTCQYCGTKRPASELNYDHVIPKSKGGRTVWENIVMSCYGCNGRKRNRTPAEAGMHLINPPVRPKSLPLPVLRMDGIKEIPSLWMSWLYWNVELQP